MIFFKAFTAGFAATMVFHQGLYALLYVAGIAPSPPFDFLDYVRTSVRVMRRPTAWGE